MMRQMVAASVLMIALVCSSGISKTWAQESNSSTKVTEQEQSKPADPYRLDFSINELEDGKKINTRQYSMTLTASQPQDIKIGTRVPVEGKQGEVQYIDVGTNISGRLQTRNGQLELFVNAEMSNFAIPEQAQGHDPRPVIRQIKVSGGAVVQTGKTIVLDSVDDPNSKRQFQLEVAITKLR